MPRSHLDVSHKQADLFGGTHSFPEGFAYEEDFISEREESELMAAINQLPLEEARYKRYLAKRRTASFGSDYDFDTNLLLPAPPLPAFVLPLRDKVAHWLALPPAAFVHALVTEYRPGTALGWHRDVHQFGIVVGISLVGWCRMRFRPYPPAAGSSRAQAFSIDLAPRSAYVLQGDIRWRWQHSVPPTKELRYSVTLRTASPRRPA